MNHYPADGHFIDGIITRLPFAIHNSIRNTYSYQYDQSGRQAAKKYLRSEHSYKMEDAQVQAGEYLERGYNLGYLDVNDNKGAFASQYVLANKKLLEQGA